MNQIFISYSHKDKEYAHKLHQYLIERDFHAWLDDKIDYGSRWQKQVEKHLRECSVFILVMSPNSEKSDWVQNELLLAKQLNKIIYTFLLEGERWWNVQSIQYIDVRNGEMPTEKFILSLAKVISESDSENSKNVTINVGGNMQGNIVVGDGNKIDSSFSVNKIYKFFLSTPRLLTVVPVFFTLLISALFVSNYLLPDFPTTDILLTNTSQLPATIPQSLNTEEYLPTPSLQATSTTGIGTSIDSKIDGMILMYVPADIFIMGANIVGSDASPIHQVYLDSYWIDQNEITNDMYALCVRDNQCNPPNNLSSNSRSVYYSNPEFYDFPVIYVSWNDANSYCKWAGRRLPTEAEWEKAARGPNGNLYPWGNNDPDSRLLNYDHLFDDTVRVGNYSSGISFYGAQDMSGNVSEWVSDWYDSYYYQDSPFRNPSGPDAGTFKVLRGGSWEDRDANVSSSKREADLQAMGYNYLGFRCAMDADQ